jgi:uncharacterized membrane protein
VAHVIIPSQRKLVNAKREGKPLDPAPGLEAKRRSVHNNYLTLPVIFAMMSPHFPFVAAHRYAWALLFALFVAGALVRHWFNLRNRGRNVIAVPAAGIALIALVAVVAAPRSAERSAVGGSSAQPAPSFADVRAILQERCVPCHSSTPTNPMTTVAAAGIAFDSPREIKDAARRIYERVVVTRTMPLANATGMTDAERQQVAQWFDAGAPVD